MPIVHAIVQIDMLYIEDKTTNIYYFSKYWDISWMCSSQR